MENELGCTREDLRVEVVATAYVEDDGNAEPDAYQWDVNFGHEPYFCIHCDRDFEVWQQALDHLNVKAAL